MNAHKQFFGLIGGGRFWLRFGIFAVTLMVAGLFFSGKLQARANMPEHNPFSLIGVSYVDATAFEERYGLKVTLVGVTAAGGMVDIRFRVTDPAKAMLILDDPNLHPMLFDMDSRVQIMQEEGMLHYKHFDKDKVYYMLFTNPGGKVKRGASVVVQIGDLFLQPMPVQ